MKTILIIEDDIVFSRSISNWLVKKGMKTECVATLANARKAIGQKEFDLILADLRLPDGNSTSLLKWMNEKYYSIPFLIMTNYGQVENAVTTMQLGAINYLCKPVQPDNLLALITEILDKNDNEQEFYRGESPKAHEMYRLIEMIACADISVLLRGASGTGKEHIAAEIHARSHRKNKPYLAIDCGAISDELAASEFFGHQKGAFTGAESDKVGLFRAVNGGTLFLDEIGNLNMETQVLLLRALQEKRYRPVGGKEEMQADIRLLTATNEDLERAISEGRFREDLFHRLNEFPLHVPLLRDCKEDIIPLAGFFLSFANEELGKEIKEFDRDVKKAFKAYSWPGNIRELKSVVRRACVLAQGDWITLKDIHLPVEVKPSDDYRLDMERTELEAIKKALETTGNDRKAAARLLGISRSTLYLKLKKYGLS